MSEQTFWGATFADFLKANPHVDFEALRARFAEIQKENQRQNALVRHEYLRRLEAEKDMKRRADKQAAERAALAREAEVKRQLRYRYATMTESQYDAFWPDIYKEFLLAEANNSYHEMRRQYQF